MYFTLQYIRLRACLKNAFRKKSYISEILNVFLFQNYI